MFIVIFFKRCNFTLKFGCNTETENLAWPQHLQSVTSHHWLALRTGRRARLGYDIEEENVYHRHGTLKSI